MQKTLDFLEKNVHWIALGLGGVYLLFMVYSYVLQAPVTTTLGSETVGLRNIDKITREGPAQRLENAVQVGAVPDMRVETFAEGFKARIEKMKDYPVLAGLWTTSITSDVEIKTDTPVENVGVGDAVLPTAAAPVYVALSRGLSTVAIPAGIAAPNPEAANPVVNRNDAPGAGKQMDKQWVSTSWKVNTKQMAADFKKANIPDQLRQTLFLRVEATREEWVDGKWGNPTVVPALAIHPLPPMPTDWQGELAYVDWATKNQVEIVQPSFYEVVAADRWLPPGFQSAKVAETPGDFDPANPPNRSLTKEEIELILQYKKDQAKRERDNPKPKPTPKPATPTRSPTATPVRPPRGPTGPGMMPPGGQRAPRDLEREQLAQNTPRNAGYPGGPAYPGDPRGYPGAQGVYPPGYPGGSGYPGPRPNNPANPDPNLPAPPPVPTGSFDPSRQPDVEIWVHDDTAQAGKTYRYKVRYAIKNPLFKVVNAVKDRKVADVLAIWSAYSDPGTQVTIPSKTNFFVSANMGGSTMVAFDVFTWQAGEQHKQTVRVGPGDMIGGDEDGVDYTTGSTVVDVRRDPRGDTYVLLMDADGTVERRDLRSDQQKDLYQKLQKETEATKMAANPNDPMGGNRPPR